MKNQVCTTVLFGAIIAVASGMTGAYAGNFFVSDSNDSNVLTQSGLMMGHVALTVTDKDGFVKDYRQSDNIIVDQGEGCALKLLFGGNGSYVDASSTDICGSDAAGASTYNWIAIGNSTGAGTGASPATATSTALFSEHNVTSGTSGFERARDTSVVITHLGGTTGSVVLSNDFVLDLVGSAGGPANGSPLEVTESGLFNSTLSTTTGMFSHQTFSPVSVDDTESLTVEWTINIGGTGPGDIGTTAEET